MPHPFAHPLSQGRRAALPLAAMLLTLPLLTCTSPPTPHQASAPPPPPAPATTPAAPIPASILVNPALSRALESLTSSTPPFVVTQVLEPDSPALLATTLAALHRNGETLRSIHVLSRAYEERCENLRNRWLEDGSIEGDGFYEFPTRRSRYHASSVLAAWNPTRKEIREEFDESFDGKNDMQFPRRYQTLGFYSGPPIPDPVPAQAIVGHLFVFNFFLGTELTPDRHTTNYTVDSRINPDAASARRVLLNDSQPAVELIFHYENLDAHVTDTWYLDPDHGPVLIACTRHSESDRNINWSHAAVYALLPAAPGIFYPQQAAFITGYNQYPHARGTYTARSIIANESRPDAFFLLPAVAPMVLPDPTPLPPRSPSPPHPILRAIP